MKDARIFDGTKWQSLRGPSTVMTIGNGVGITEDAALPFQQWAEEIAARAAFNLYGADFNVLTVLSPTWASGNVGGDGTILANGIACGELFYGSLIGRDASGRAVPAGGYQMPTPTSEGYLRADTDPSSGWYFAEPVVVRDTEPDPPAGGSAVWVNGSTGEAKAWDGSAWASIKGLNGADGTNGADGLGFNPVGEWAGCTDYNARDVVTYRGSSYVQIAAPDDACVPPDSDPAAWKLLAAAGAEGPSAVSTDAGNTLTLGSDGLLFKGVDVVFDSIPPELPTDQQAAAIVPMLWVDTSNAPAFTVNVAIPERVVEDPALGYVPVPPEWRPVGVPSNDAGNAIFLGSDGGLMLEGQTQISGLWTPVPSDGDAADGYWSRVGRTVTLTFQFLKNLAAGDDEVMEVEGIPFGVAEVYDASTSVGNAIYMAPVMRRTKGVCGEAYMTGSSSAITLMFPQPVWGMVTVSITYLTDDPPVSRGV